jgi:hypothetical protein
LDWLAETEKRNEIGKMNRYLVLGLPICLLLTSCVTDSQNPLSSPETAQADQRLLGDWSDKKDPGTGRVSMTNAAPWMQVESIDDKTGQKTDYDFFPTVISGTSFLNVQGAVADSDGHPSKNYVFLRYTISSGDVLQMWMISQDAVIAAVRAGKLKGIVHQDRISPHNGDADHDVTLLDTSANLVKFIRNSNVHALFNDEMEPLYRVKPQTSVTNENGGLN